MAFGGGAYAATQESAKSSRQAFLDDVAKRLNVSPAQLSTALQGAFQDQLQAAVAGGRITQAQANAIKSHQPARGSAPLGGWHGLRGSAPLGGGRLFGARAGALPAAASYLGLSDAQLIARLSAGKSLSQVAAARGKSVAGLEDAIEAASRSRLDKLVAAKMITSAQEQQLLARLSAMLDSQVNRPGPLPLPRFGMRRFGPGGPIAPNAPAGLGAPSAVPAPPPVPGPVD